MALGLAHVRVEVVEVAQLLRSEACIGIRGIISLVVLHIDEHFMLARSLEQLLVVFEELDRRFRDKDVDAALDGVQRNRVVGGVRGEDSDCGR